MVESEKQYAIYFLGFVVGILLGFVIWQSEDYNQYHGLLSFGITILVVMIINSMIFGKYLDQSIAFVVGLISIVTICLGTFYSFDLVLTVFALILTTCFVAGIYLSASGYLSR